MTRDLTTANFKSEVQDYPGLVLVDFWAPWCSPCKSLSPIIEELALDLGPKLKVVKVSVEDYPEIATLFEVTSLPTVLLFDHGQVKQTWVGFRQKQDFLSAIG